MPQDPEKGTCWSVCLPHPPPAHWSTARSSASHQQKYQFFYCKLLELSLVCFEVKAKFRCLMLSNNQELEVYHFCILCSSQHFSCFPGLVIGATLPWMLNSGIWVPLMRKHMPALLPSQPTQEQGSSPELSGCSRTAQQLISNKPAQHRNPSLHRAIAVRPPRQPPQETPALQNSLLQGSC